MYLIIFSSIFISFFIFHLVIILFSRENILVYKINKVPQKFDLIKEDYKNLKRNEKKKYYDKINNINLKDGYILFHNKKFIDIELYNNNKENIKQYLNSDFIDIQRHKDKYIKVYYKDYFKSKKFNIKEKKEDKIINLGLNEEGKNINIGFEDLSNFLISGVSGSGKSYFTNNFILNLFQNIDHIEKIFMVDFKRVEFTKYHGLFQNKIKTVVELEKLKDIINELYNENIKRQKQSEEVLLNKSLESPIFLIFDEWGDFIDNLKSEDKEIQKLTKEIYTKIEKMTKTIRSQNIYFTLITQYPKEEKVPSSLRVNLQTRISLRMNNKTELGVVLGSLPEELENFDIKTMKPGMFLFSGFKGDFYKGKGNQVGDFDFLDLIKDDKEKEKILNRLLKQYHYLQKKKIENIELFNILNTYKKL